MTSQNFWDSVALITSSSAEHSEDLGTAFTIYQDEQATYLLTCAHVVRDLGGCEHIKADGIEAKVITPIDSKNFDLAVLQVKGLRNRPPLKLCTAANEMSSFIIPGCYKYAQKDCLILRKLKGKLGQQTKALLRDKPQRINAWDLRIEGEHCLKNGYSGSPVIDEQTSCVFSVASYKGDNMGREGLAFSIEALSIIWTEMPTNLINIINPEEEKMSSSSRDSRSRGASSGTSRRLERGEVFDKIIDATLHNYQQREQNPRQDLLDQLCNSTSSSSLPCHYFYITDSGCENWVKLCNHPQYDFYRKSIDFLNQKKDNILEVIKDTIQAKPDYISLGPGDGHKDRILLQAFLEEINSYDVYYYPYDINPTMISKAIQQISTIDNISQRIKIKAMVGDFKRIQDFRPVYEYRKEPNVFVFLGNTLGNYQDERVYLEKINSAMNTNDILLLEVRLLAGLSKLENYLGSNGDLEKPDGDLELTKIFNFEPLALLGVKYESHQLKYRLEENSPSQITNTKTVYSFYENYKIDENNKKIKIINNAPDELKLSCVNYYDEIQLSRTLVGKRINFHIIDTIINEDKSLALYVLKKLEDKSKK